MEHNYFAYILFLIVNCFIFDSNGQEFSKVTSTVHQGNVTINLVSIHDLKSHKNITDISIEEQYNIPILKKFTFEGFFNLYRIQIRRTNLRNFDQRVFRNLPQLRILNLNFNDIQYIPENVFSNLYVKTITLRGNGIENLSSNAFSNLPNLRFLDLAMNEIKDIPKDLFIGTGNLKHLDLSYNKLRHYPAIPYKPYSYFEQAFANAIKFESTKLDLSFNNFTFISYYLLRGIHFIEELKLNGNHIELISEYALDDLKWVKSFDIQHNNLKEINEGLLIMLEVAEEIKMEQNPWTNKFTCRYEQWCKCYNKMNTIGMSCLGEFVNYKCFNLH